MTERICRGRRYKKNSITDIGKGERKEGKESTKRSRRQVNKVSPDSENNSQLNSQDEETNNMKDGDTCDGGD